MDPLAVILFVYRIGQRKGITMQTSKAAQRRIDWCNDVFAGLPESGDWLTALHRMTTEPRSLGRGVRWISACAWIEATAKDLDLNSEPAVRWAVQQGSVWFCREDAIGK
jgi:hypothetical protein